MATLKLPAQPEENPAPAPAAGHAVQFYESTDGLSETVTSFLMEGLRRGEPLLVIATVEHRDRFAARMRASGFDYDRACETGQLAALDARDTIAGFMDGRMPDEHRFADVVGGLLRGTASGSDGACVRAYGEMVDLLWRDGNPAAALRVEELWNDLGRTHRFSLLCGYAMEHFAREADGDRFQQVCAHHHRVIPAESFPLAGEDDARLREISRLQQRAAALEAEIARRKRTEEELRRANREAERANRVKSDFLAVMSHELRTPLNAIIGYRELLDQEVAGPLTPVQRTYLGRIEAGAQQLLGLIEQILCLSRIEAGTEDVQPEPIDVCALAIEAAELLEAGALKKGLDFRVLIPDHPVVCETDPRRLRQILLNLLANAVKFTVQGSVELKLRVGDGSVVFEVSDTGEGIEASELSRIFEPFVQVTTPAARHNGTGLGLPVSRELARLLGGEISVSSHVGVGSAFRLQLAMPPRAEPAPAAAA